MGGGCEIQETITMGNIKVGRLAKNRLVKDLGGNIIDWYDEANGGWIVQKRQIVNMDKWNEHLQKEKDRQEAAKAVTMQKVDPKAPDRSVNPSKIDELEKRIDGVDSKLDAILSALKK